MNLVNVEFHQSVVEHYPNLVLKFTYLKDLGDLDPFNISGVDRGKERKQGKLVLDINTIISYKNPFMINRQPVVVSFSLGEGVACNTIFSCPFLQIIEISIMTKNNDLINGLLGEQFNLEIMVTQRAKESPKISE